MPASENLHIKKLMRCSKKHRYSITSSARVSSEGGTARPSAFAVLRLITNSSTLIAERRSPPLLDQLGAKTSVLDVGY